MIRFILITNQPALTAHAVAAGVGRIMVDLEIRGKQQRQGHLDTLISRHAMSDVAPVKAAIEACACATGQRAELMVRLDPMHPDIGPDVDAALAAGADLLMLPMWRTPDEVSHLCQLVRGRARVVPLLETREAADCVHEAARIGGVSEMYIGLNDLHRSLDLSFMFEPLADGTVERLAGVMHEAGIPFGFGGIARIGDGALPAERVLGEHLRLGSHAVILSRAFHGQQKGLSGLPEDLDLGREIRRLREAETVMRARDAAAVERDRDAVVLAVRAIALEIQRRRSEAAR